MTNVLITGSEPIALRVAEALMTEHQVVSLRPEGLHSSSFDRLDIGSVIGSPTSPEALRRARVESADVFVACSDNDEQNIVACLAARKLGAQRTICVLSRPNFLSGEDENRDVMDSLGITEIIRPAQQLAQEIVRIVTTPGALDVRAFADNRIFLLRCRVEENAPITRGPLKQVTLPSGVVLVRLQRGDEFIVPRGNTRIQARDSVTAMGKRHAVESLATELRQKARSEKRTAAIVGAGSVGLTIAQELEMAGWQITIIELDEKRCEVAASQIKGLVLHGNGADLDLLDQEGVGDMSVVVSVTNNDERNLLVSLLAKSLGVPRIVTRADRLANERMFEKVGVDVVLSATGAAVRTIVKSIDTRHSEIRAELDHGDTCVMELTLPPGFPPTKLASLKPPEDAVVGSISRGRELIIPHGNDKLLPGDAILVFCRTSNEDRTRRFFTEPDTEAEANVDSTG